LRLAAAALFLPAGQVAGQVAAQVSAQVAAPAIHHSSFIIHHLPSPPPMQPDLITLQAAIAAIEGGTPGKWNARSEYGPCQITLGLARDWLNKTRGIAFADNSFAMRTAAQHYDEIVLWHLEQLCRNQKLRARCATTRDLVEKVAYAWRFGLAGVIKHQRHIGSDYGQRVANIYQKMMNDERKPLS